MITGKSDDVIKRLQVFADSFHDQLVKAVGDAIGKAENISKTQFLNGPHPIRIQTRSGALKQSVRSMVEKVDEIKGVLSAGNPPPYAAIHELSGYAGRGRKVFIRARPYLRPAIDAVKPILETRIKSIINKGMK